MTPFTVVIQWNNPGPPAVDLKEIERAGTPGAQDDQKQFAVPGAVALLGLRAVVPGESLDSGAIVDRERRRLIVGDVCLHGRDELGRKLSLNVDDFSDLSLAYRAVDRFGAEVAAHLAGDFSFLVWDWGERHLFAVRDHVGIRPLHWRLITGGVALGTDVRRLLAVRFDGSRQKRGASAEDLDDRSVRAFLTDGRIDRDRTFFRDVRQVRPGHLFLASQRLQQEKRYWWPPRELSRLTKYDDYLQEWRHLFRMAVSDRLRSQFPVCAHLSGGLDSGSVVAVAHTIYEEGAGDRPDFLALSAVFPGLSCDESDRIDAVLERVPKFGSERWDGTIRNSIEFEKPLVVGPGIRGTPGTGPWLDLPKARMHGARVLLVGDGGDELGFGRGIFRDLVTNGRLTTLLREAWKFDSWPRRRRHLPDAAYGLFPAAWVEKINAFRFRSEKIPPWLEPNFASRSSPVTQRGEFDTFSFCSRMQREIWEPYGGCRAFSGFDARSFVAREFGIDVRAPYLDVRLINFVLSIPWQFRKPNGDMRRLQRDAVQKVLPRSVLSPVGKTLFGEAHCHQVRLNWDLMRRIIHGKQWLSRPYVSQKAAQSLMVETRSLDPNFRHSNSWRPVGRIAALETWLRHTLSL